MRGKTERLGTIIEKILIKKGFVRSIEQKTVSEILSNIFEGHYKNQFRVHLIKNGKLHIACKSPSIRYELSSFKKDIIIDLLKSRGIEISDIVFDMED